MSNDPSTTMVAPKEPKLPEGADAAQAEALRQEATQMVTQVKSRLSDPMLRLEMQRLGADAEEKAGARMSLLDQRVGKMVKDIDGEGSGIPKNLMALRKVADDLNPHTKLAEIENMNGFKRAALKLIGRLPGIGDVLAEIGHKYETIQQSIDGITDGLRGGIDQLRMDNVEMAQLYKQVQETDLEVQAVAYRGELLWAELEKARDAAADDAERRRYDAVIAAVARRVQDLRTMQTVFGQFYTSLDLTIDGNVNLIDSGQRTITVTTNVLNVGLQIQAALHRQKKAAQAVKATQEMTADILTQNAKAVRQQGTEIAQLQANPVLALEKVQEAHNDLLAAMDEIDQIKATTVQNAKGALKQLSSMNSEMRDRAGALSSATEAQGLLDDGNRKEG